MIYAAARVTKEEIALRQIDVDIDAVFLIGYGFPWHLCGPLKYADQVGAAALVRQVRVLCQRRPILLAGAKPALSACIKRLWFFHDE